MKPFLQLKKLHAQDDIISLKQEGLFHIIPFLLLRKTNSVNFHTIPMIKEVTGIERVVHEEGAKIKSPKSSSEFSGSSGSGSARTNISTAV